MKIGLIDIDNQIKKAKFPNIALMKIASYHKSIGNTVEWYNTQSFNDPYDVVYMSKVFDFSLEPDYPIYSKKIIKGGVGYNLKNKLDDIIENQFPDYSIYNITDTAYGFLSRGCPRNCSFCNVTQHQGRRSVKVADLSEFWDGQKEIVLLDPNLTLCRQKYDILDQLIESKATIDFSQGLDIRSLTKKFISKLNELKFNTLHFAWDNYEFKTYEKLKKARPLLKGGRRKYTVYVLINFETTIDQDLERINKLKELDYWPFVMIYDKPNASILHTKMQRWVNNRIIWERNWSYDEYINSFKKVPYEYYKWKGE